MPAVANHRKGVFAHADRGNDSSETSSLKCRIRSPTYDSTSSNLPAENDLKLHVICSSDSYANKARTALRENGKMNAFTNWIMKMEML